MNDETFALLGLSKEELQSRVVDQICERVLSSVGIDDEGGEHSYPSQVRVRLQAAAKKQIDDALNDFADKFIVPGISKHLETLVLQPTSQYGEKKGTPQTFLEYLTRRAEEWLGEKVNEKGQTRKEDSYSFKEHSTRAVWIIDQQLQKKLSDMMTGQIAATHAQLGQVMQDTIKSVFERTFSNLKVETETFIMPKG